MDRRVVKTKTALRKALFVLLAREPIDRISVSALCREAQVTRRTFYTHYDRVEDVFTEYQEDMRRQVERALSTGKMDAQTLLKVFDRILMANFDAFAYMCRNLHEQQLVQELQEMLFATFCEQLVSGQPTAQQQLTLQYAAYGVVNSYVYWFNHVERVQYADVVTTNRQLLTATLAVLA